MKIQAIPHLISKNSSTGKSVYTFILRYPRIILPEFLTHRVMSRNTASARAIPAKKYRSKATFTPSYIGANQKGMAAGVELQGWRRSLALAGWEIARLGALVGHHIMEFSGAHKQVTNRLLDSFVWIEQIATFTDYENFLTLRNHEKAEPHFQELTKEIAFHINQSKLLLGDVKKSETPYMDYSTPEGERCRVQILKPHEWHLPFVWKQPTSNGGAQQFALDNALVDSTAMCARVSYFLPDGSPPKWEDQKRIHDDLVGSDPKHMSPAEHPCKALSNDVRCGNFSGGWKQYRQYIEEGDLEK